MLVLASRRGAGFPGFQRVERPIRLFMRIAGASLNGRMPKIYRVMKKEDGRPALGESATTLGVRVASTISDIPVDADGRVQPGTGGMSVSPSLRDLPYRLIPRRLRRLVPRAVGNDSLFVWSMGGGAFADGAIAPGLQLRVDPKNENHGFVEPNALMTLEEYQFALSATRD